jgi:hypothetical protein
MAYIYKYQVVRALDDMIGPDLRGIVEGYLGLDSELTRTHHSVHNIWMIKEGIVAWFGSFSTFLQGAMTRTCLRSTIRRLHRF